jgi:hypothetical protein
MKAAFLLISLVLLASWAIQDNPSAVDIEVREFSWSHYRGNAPVNSNRDGKGDLRSRERVFRQQMENRNSVENRSRDMRELEDSVMRESFYTKEVDLYRYKVALRNNGTKTVKAVFWDYQIRDPIDPDNPSHRQFRCVIKISPNKSESMVALSFLPPVRVIHADGGKSLQESLVINRLEFSDGTHWQRPDWHLPEVSSAKNSLRGKCQPL